MDDPALRPQEWDEYHGQHDLKARLDVHIRAALAHNRPLAHVLLAGPPGVGKTTIAKIIASRLDDPIVMFSKPIPARQFIREVRQLGAGVVFVDEAHRLSKAAQEDLLPLLEDGYLDTPGGRLECPWITVIAATTERDKIIRPLLDRFPVKPTFDPYTEDDLTRIVEGFARRAGVAIDEQDASVLAKAAGGVPRHARELIVAYRDLWQANGSRPMAEEVIVFCDIEADGLTRGHLDYLDYLDRLGGQAGIETLANRMQLHQAEVRDLERLLLDRQLLVLTSGGRFITTSGRERLHGDVRSSRPNRRRPA